jgi:23S rRNA (adenine2503-C2)-methyltransferase
LKPIKENLKGIPLEELEAKLKLQGHPAYRASQLFLWINQYKESDFSKMTNLSKKFREDLTEHFCLPKISIHSEQKSNDGTVKYLVELEDKQKVESVFIPTEGRSTLCVSTQVGCKMACSFCATGQQGFIRNLKSWEIVDQLYSLPFPNKISNIVLMGMGEPFDNWDEMVRALKIFQHPMGQQIGKRHITVSTVGITSRIQDFFDLNLGKLAISLHGTTDEQRSQIMPVNKKYPLEELLALCRSATIKGRNKITFEYLLIKDFNDSKEDAHRLVKLMRDIPNKINLLAYNENKYVDFKRPSEETILRFQNILLNANLTATYRISRGRDIAAACGQLKTDSMTESKKRATIAASATPQAPYSSSPTPTVNY